MKDWCRGQRYEQLIEVELTRDGGGMYDDGNSWPIKCPSCGHGFTESIEYVKSRLISTCPKCSSNFCS